MQARIIATWPKLLTDRGWQAETARALNVDRATVCRDVDAILGDMGVTYRLLRALVFTTRERALYERLGLPVTSLGPVA